MLEMEIAKLVASGKVTEKQVLLAINEIKRESNLLSHFEILSRIVDAEKVLSGIPDSPILSPYKVAERIDSWKNLSPDAKVVTELILNSSQDTHPQIYSEKENKQEKINKKKLRVALKRQFRWKHRKIDKVFKEIQRFCDGLEAS